jgi:hypothetical protein
VPYATLKRLHVARKRQDSSAIRAFFNATLVLAFLACVIGCSDNRDFAKVPKKFFHASNDIASMRQHHFVRLTKS